MANGTGIHREQVNGELLNSKTRDKTVCEMHSVHTTDNRYIGIR